MKTNFLIAALSATWLVTPALAQDPLLPTLPEAITSAQIWRWRVQPAIGSVYQMRLFTRVRLEFPATEEEPAFVSNSMVKITADLEALRRDAAGATRMRLTLRALNGNSTIEKGASAAQRNASANRLKYGNARTAKAMTGQSLQFTLKPDGNIAQLKDGEFGARTLHVINGLQFETPIYQVLKNFGYQLPGLFLAPAPQRALRVGETWDAATLLPRPSSFVMQLKGQRMLKSLGAGVALIAEKSQATVPTELAQMFPYDIKGQGSATARIDMDSGMPREINLDLRLQPELIDSDSDGKFVMRSTQENSTTRVVFERMSK